MGLSCCESRIWIGRCYILKSLERGVKSASSTTNHFIHRRMLFLQDFASMSPLQQTLTRDRAVARLGEPIIRNGDTPASNYRFDSIYGKDPYFRNKSPASILCMPISKLGVLYLENLHVLQAFPAKRLEVLKLLCAQAAITIEKAQMYRSMEEAKQAAEAATLMKSTCTSYSFRSNF